MSVLLGNNDSSYLNESKLSQLTKGSAERDFKEINSLINEVRDHKGNISALSLSKSDHSCSLLSAQGIWDCNHKQEDSVNFLEELQRLTKTSQNKKTNTNNSSFNINNNNSNILTQEEDYDDLILDENVSSVKTKQLQHITNKGDFNQNNLFQLSQKGHNGNNSSDNNEGDDYNENCNENYQIKKETKEDDENQLKIKAVILQGIESGKYYTPKTNKITSKYDLIDPTFQSQFQSIQRELNFDSVISNIGNIHSNNNLTTTNKLPMMAMPITGNNGDLDNCMLFPSFNANAAVIFNSPAFEPKLNREQNKAHNNYKYNNRGNSSNHPQNKKNYQKNKNSGHSNEKGKRNSSNINKKIILDDILIGNEKRTTLMLRNIPNKYTLTNLVEEINSSFWGKYDYVNLPIDYERKLNLGYAFINFVDPLHIILFYETYHMKKWNKYKSDKKMDMTYADKQGKKDINAKDEQTYFAVEDKRFNFSSLSPKLEIPIRHLDFFKKIYPNSVCVVIEDKHPIYNDKVFVVKNIGKK